MYSCRIEKNLMDNNGIISEMQLKQKDFLLPSCIWQVLQETLERMLQLSAWASLLVANIEGPLCCNPPIALWVS